MAVVELFKDFKYEALESIHQMNSDLLALERSPQEAENINRLFRNAHNLKGSSAMMGFISLSELAHQLEDILELFRNRTLTVTSERVDLLFEGFDLLSEIVNGLKEEGENISSALRERLAVHSVKLKKMALQGPEVEEKDPLAQLRKELSHLDEQVLDALKEDLAFQEKILEMVIQEIHEKKAGASTLESLRRSLHTIGGAVSAVGVNSLFILVDHVRQHIEAKDFSITFLRRLNLLLEANRAVVAFTFPAAKESAPRAEEPAAAPAEEPRLPLLKTYKEELDRVEPDIWESVAKEYKSLQADIRLPLERRPLSEREVASYKKALKAVKGSSGLLRISTLREMARQLEEGAALADPAYLAQLEEFSGLLVDFLEPAKLAAAIETLSKKAVPPPAAAEEKPVPLFMEEEEVFIPPAAAQAPSVTAIPIPRPPSPEEGLRKAFETEKEQIPAEMREEFLEEFRGYSDQLRALEEMLLKTPESVSPEEFKELRRIAHTIKGSAAMLGLTLLSQPALKVEQAIDSGTPLFQYLGDFRELLKMLAFLFEEKVEIIEKVPPPPAALFEEEGIPAPAAPMPQAAPSLEAELESLFIEEAPAPAAPPKPAMPALEEELESLFIEEYAPPAPAVPSEVFERAEEMEKLELKLTPARRAVLIPGTEKALKPTTGRLEDQLIRVDLSKLDELLNLVGELITFRTGIEEKMKEERRVLDELNTSTNRLLKLGSVLESQYQLLTASGAAPSQFAAEFDTLEFDRYTAFYQWSREISETAADTLTFQKRMGGEIKEVTELVERYGGILKDLQDRTLKTRMVPLGSITSKLPRAVRDMAKAQGKDIRVTVEGEDLEIDKSLANQLDEPLIHLIRNSVDHGIETTEERRKKGKSEQGTIHIKASRSGDSFRLELSDDGGGVNLDKIRAAAAQRGVTEVHRLASEDLLKLIFMPGFSTAAKVGELSGRGVGLDVVRESIEALRGTLQLSTVPGKGTTFLLSLPLTLSIVKALILQEGEEIYAIPSSYVIQTLFISPSQIIKEGEKSFVAVKEERVPTYFLKDFIGLPHREAPEHYNGVLLSIGADKYFLIVDSFINQQEILIKPIGAPLDHIPGIAGASITATGKVFLILETEQVMEFLETGKIEKEPPVEGYVPPRVKVTPTVLVVDDSLSIRAVVSRALEKAGYKVLTAKDGAEAIQVLKEEKVDGMILDVEMPKMSGFEVLSAMRSTPEYIRIPVAMLTSRAGEKHRQKALALGANDYVTKPYKEEEFLRIVSRLIPR